MDVSECIQKVCLVRMDKFIEFLSGYCSAWPENNVGSCKLENYNNLEKCCVYYSVKLQVKQPWKVNKMWKMFQN